MNKETAIFKEGYAIRDQFAMHFLTFKVCGWIDLFARQVYRDIVLDALRFTQRQEQLILHRLCEVSRLRSYMPCVSDAQKIYFS